MYDGKWEAIRIYECKVQMMVIKRVSKEKIGK